VHDLTTHSVHVIGPLYFRLQYNSGVAFSIGTSFTGIIVIAVIAVVALVIYYARRTPSTSAAIAVGLILGGALGNLADRLFRGHHGAVVDFIYTRYWPTFNVADSCVVCGCALLAWSLLRTPAQGNAPAQPLGSPSTDNLKGSKDSSAAHVDEAFRL
jgi:signal peptidase II